MRRKRIKINSVGTASQKRQYAAQVCHRLSAKLEAGWNPWIEADADRSYKLFSDALIHYRNYITKLLNDGVHRASTHHDYICFARIMEEWNDNQRVSIRYVYQFDRAFCVRFLDYVYIERENSPRTRNNYLAFLRSFSAFWCNICISKKNRRMGWLVLARLCSRKNVRLLLWMICNACMIGFKRIIATSFWFATFCTTCLSVRRRLPNSGCVIYPSVNRRFILTIQSRKISVRHVLLYPRKLSS